MGQEKHNTEKKKWEQLTEKARYKIEALHQQGLKPSAIGDWLTPERDRRTIEREIAQGMTLQRSSDLTEKIVYLGTVEKSDFSSPLKRWQNAVRCITLTPIQAGSVAVMKTAIEFYGALFLKEQT